MHLYSAISLNFMPLYPSSISSYANATPGEKHLHRIFQELYGDSEDVYVWYEPYPIRINNTQKRSTDFVIYSPDFGIILLEVKDWFKSTIQKISDEDWEILDNKEPKSVHSPFRQAKTCFFGLKDTLEQHPIMLQQDDMHRNRLCLPINYAVVFTKIEKSFFVNAGTFFDLYDERMLLTREDIDIDYRNLSDLKKFENSIINISSVCFFSFNSLNNNQVKVLRAVLKKEIVIPPEPEKPITKSNVPDLNVLDPLQEELASTLGVGFHKIIKGVVGSGKTLVLAYRAFFLQKYYPEFKILFVCFNKSLRKYFEFLITDLSSRSGISINIDILHYHDLVKTISKRPANKLNGESDEEWDNRIGMQLLNSASPVYDSILIDEAQDFSTLWLKSIRKLLTDNEELLLAFDPAQDIYHRNRVWKDAEINLIGGGGAKSKILKIAYRNTNQILHLAIKFRGLENYVDDSSGDSNELIKPISNNANGAMPIIREHHSIESILDNISNEIDSLVRTKKYSYQDFAILSVSPVINNFFKDNFILLNDHIENFIKSNNTINLSPSKNTIKALTAYSSKGLEWKVVYLLGVDDIGFKHPEDDASIIYIGLTRAREVLNIPYITQNRFVKKLNEANS